MGILNDQSADGSAHTHIVYNGKRELTLDELASSQPGLDRLMAELSPRMHRLYYAGKAENWRLASYFFKSITKQLQLCAFSRPKYAAPIASYLCRIKNHRHPGLPPLPPGTSPNPSRGPS